MNILLKAWVALLSLVWPAYAFGETPATAGSGMRFRCESDRSQPHYCAVDTSEGVTLVKQLSGMTCMQGRNWDYDRQQLIPPDLEDRIYENIERQHRHGERIFDWFTACKLAYPFSVHFVAHRATESMCSVRRSGGK